MAAYAATVSLAGRGLAEKIGNRGLWCIRGTINVTNYNSTLAEITALTKKFRSGFAPTVILGGVSSNGYLVAWDTTGKAVKAFYPSIARTHAHDLLVKGGQAAAGTAALAHYATNILGKEAATDATIAKADSATKGGVISETLAAAAGTEVANDVNVGTVSFIAFGEA